MDERLRRAGALVYVEDLEAPACGPDDAHHLLDVLRLAPGDEVAAGDGEGRYRLCRIAAAPVGRRRRAGEATLEPTSPVCGPAPHPRRPVAVGFALQKGDRPEWTVQKLTELGVEGIVPLLSERTVVRLDEHGAHRRGERLRRVAREAAAQSRRLRLPAVADPAPLARQLAALAAHRTAFAEPGGGPLGEASAVLVGPEGGWSAGELGTAPALLDLGPLVLRAETAALVAAVLLGLPRPPGDGGPANE